MPYDPKWETEVKLESWRQALLDAADIIEQCGWWKAGVVSKGEHCIVTALVRVRGDRSGWSLAWDKLQNYVGDDSLPRWNDAPERTKEQVLFAMRDCARQP